jgi:hypothetical protein
MAQYMSFFINSSAEWFLRETMQYNTYSKADTCGRVNNSTGYAVGSRPKEIAAI